MSTVPERLWNQLHTAEVDLRFATVYAANSLDEDPTRYTEDDIAEYAERVQQARAEILAQVWDAGYEQARDDAALGAEFDTRTKNPHRVTEGSGS